MCHKPFHVKLIPSTTFYCNYYLKLMKKETLTSHDVLYIHTPFEVRVSFCISFKQ